MVGRLVKKEQVGFQEECLRQVNVIVKDRFYTYRKDRLRVHPRRRSGFKKSTCEREQERVTRAVRHS